MSDKFQGLYYYKLEADRRRSMRFIITIVIALLLTAALANAQTSIAVDINKAKLSWSHEGATQDAPLDGFRMYCGKVSGASDKVTDLPPTARSMAIKDAILGSGAWFCRVTAFNQHGESGASNEVPFSAGAVPSSPFGLQVTAQ